MKLLLDFDNKMSRHERNSTIKILKILKNEIENIESKKVGYLSVFKNNYRGDFENDILSKINIKVVTDVNSAIQQFKELTNLINSNINIQRNLDPKYIKQFDRGVIDKNLSSLELQKITLELNGNEITNKFEIMTTIENMDDGSIFKSVVDNGDNTISVYTSTFGLWKHFDYDTETNNNGEYKRVVNYSTRKIFDNSDEGLKRNFQIKKLTDAKVSLDSKRINFPIVTMINELYSKELISSFSKYVQYSTMEWRDESPKYHIQPIHVCTNEKVTEEDYENENLRLIEVEKIEAETSHLNRPTPLTKETHKMISNNGGNINSVYPILNTIIEETKKETVDEKNTSNEINVDIDEEIEFNVSGNDTDNKIEDLKDNSFKNNLGALNIKEVEENTSNEINVDIDEEIEFNVSENDTDNKIEVEETITEETINEVEENTSNEVVIEEVKTEKVSINENTNVSNVDLKIPLNNIEINAKTTSKNKKIDELVKEKIEKAKIDNVSTYYEKLIRELEESQKKQKIELEEKIKNSEIVVKKKFEEFIVSLQNGNDFDRSIENVGFDLTDVSKKRIMEEVKNELLLSIVKDKIIEEEKSVIGNLEQKILRQNTFLNERAQLIKEKTSEVDILKSSIIEMSEKFDDLNNLKEELETLNASQKLEILDIKEEYERIVKESEEKDIELEELYEVKEDFKKLVPVFNEQKEVITLLNTENQKKDNEINSFKDEIELLKKQLSEKDILVNDLSNKNKELTSDNKELREKNIEISREKQQLHSNLNDTQTNLTEAFKTLTSMTNENKELSIDNKKLTKELEEESKKYNDKFEEQIKRIKDLENENTLLKQKIGTVSNSEVSNETLLKLNEQNKELLKEGVITKEDSKLSNTNPNNKDNEDSKKEDKTSSHKHK